MGITLLIYVHFCRNTQGTSMAWCNTFCSFGTYVENLKFFFTIMFTNKSSTCTFTVIKCGKCGTSANFFSVVTRNVNRWSCDYTITSLLLTIRFSVSWLYSSMCMVYVRADFFSERCGFFEGAGTTLAFTRLI